MIDWDRRVKPAEASELTQEVEPTNQTDPMIALLLMNDLNAKAISYVLVYKFLMASTPGFSCVGLPRMSGDGPMTEKNSEIRVNRASVLTLWA